MTVHVSVAPEVLVWAVDRAGWGKDDIENRIPKFFDWVAGDSKPTLKQIQRFAESTHVPLSTMFLPEPPQESIPIPDMRTFANQELKKPSANLLDTIYLAQARQDWFTDYAADFDLESPGFVGSARLTDSPAKVAAQIREALDFGVDERSGFQTWQDALRDLIDRIERLGVLVMVSGIVGNNTHRKLDPKEFRGFALSDPVAPLIFVNGADTKAAQIFTLVHELAHVWLGHSALSDAAMVARSSVDEELWCNAVAAEVLLPKDHLREGSRTSGSGDMRILQAGRLFSKAVICSTLAGFTSYRDAYRLLGVRKHSTFEKLAERLPH
ncbi:MAG: ImmA/IrrE family metallo-endopeptidase [Actinomycetaceae bacterium]|nr:ImmA/IrrE family metallo-endopeptidase [Actinomycetaceae bacterium]